MIYVPYGWEFEIGEDCFTLDLAAVAVFVDSFLKVMNKFALVF